MNNTILKRGFWSAIDYVTSTQYTTSMCKNHGRNRFVMPPILLYNIRVVYCVIQTANHIGNATYFIIWYKSFVIQMVYTC